VRALEVRVESWPTAERFSIARGEKWEARVVVAEIREAGHRGRGECVPYARYGESVEGVAETLASWQDELAAGMSREELRRARPAGAARNAADCALWDLEARQRGTRVWELAGLPRPSPFVTAFTISLDAPEAMARAAGAARRRPLLKVKLGAEGDAARIRAVREAAPEARLIVDANEGWDVTTLETLSPALAEARVELVEQPLPAADDAGLEGLELPVRLCADESVHGVDTLESLVGRYDLVNVKLDKTGGLTEAIDVVATARDLGFDIMLGCMVGTSLAMAPAALLAGLADYVDLDGPLLLASDREPGLRYDDARVSPPDAELWG
jgi:L-alanine-DL-glutamate epimerase-like enolase superfamily enzyme